MHNLVQTGWMSSKATYNWSASIQKAVMVLFGMQWKQGTVLSYAVRPLLTLWCYCARMHNLVKPSWHLQRRRYPTEPSGVMIHKATEDCQSRNRCYTFHLADLALWVTRLQRVHCQIACSVENVALPVSSLRKKSSTSALSPGSSSFSWIRSRRLFPTGLSTATKTTALALKSVCRPKRLTASVAALLCSNVLLMPGFVAARSGTKHWRA